MTPEQTADLALRCGRFMRRAGTAEARLARAQALLDQGWPVIWPDELRAALPHDPRKVTT